MKLKDSTQKIKATLAKGEDMTKSDIQYLLNKNVTQKRIGKALDMEKERFCEWWNDWNNHNNKRGPYNKKANKEAKQLVAEGKLSVDEIVEKTGAKKTTVQDYKYRLKRKQSKG